MDNNKMHELKQIRHLMFNDNKDSKLMLYTINKQNKMEGMASFCLDYETIAVFEGKGDGSEDKEMSYEKFIENYDFALGLENSDIRYTINGVCNFGMLDNFNNIKRNLNDKHIQGCFAFLDKGDNSCYLVNNKNKISLQYFSHNDFVDTKDISIKDLNLTNTVTLYTYMCEELDRFISIHMENNKKINL